MKYTFLRLGIATALLATQAEAQVLSLPAALALIEQHPQWQAAHAQISQAQGEQQTAMQYQNPIIDLVSETQDKRGLSIAQPLETSAVRHYRQASTEQGLQSARYQLLLLRRQLNAQIKRAYYTILQRQQELTLATEEFTLLTQLRHAVKLRVQVGESPRYEAVKAEAEWLASKSRQMMATQTLLLARQQLSEKLGLTELPDVVIPDLEQQMMQCQLAQADKTPLDQHYMIYLAQTELNKNQQLLRYEEALVTPQPTVIVATEQETGIDRFKVGISVPLALWHQRDGQIATAKAKVTQSQAQLMATERQLRQNWSQSVLTYQIANAQLESFDSGLLAEAKTAFEVAKAAYKYGERGILDYIDAQRTLASVQRSYVSSQFERYYACIDIVQYMSDSQGE
jgi:cobalt-zinc-cadmium efflux system outer membrane protein